LLPIYRPDGTLNKKNHLNKVVFLFYTL